MIKISTIIKTDIDFKINQDLLMKLLKTNKSTAIAHRALCIANNVKDIIKPKFILKKINISSTSSNSVLINSNNFKSKILANKLRGHTTAFAFIVTCGKEISCYIDSASDYLDNYILDQIAYMGYLTALESMQETLEKDFKVKKYTSLAPGSLLDWNVSEVKKIFKVIGNDYQKIDVDVLDSGMVNPLKSTSGILFPTNDIFHSCEICMKMNCPNRNSRFSEEKYAKAINL